MTCRFWTKDGWHCLFMFVMFGLSMAVISGSDLFLVVTDRVLHFAPIFQTCILLTHQVSQLAGNLIKSPNPNSRNLTCTPLKIFCAVFLEHLWTRTKSKQAWSKGIVLALWKFYEICSYFFSNSNDASTPSYPTTASWRAACPNLQHKTGCVGERCARKEENHAE